MITTRGTLAENGGSDPLSKEKKQGLDQLLLNRWKGEHSQIFSINPETEFIS